jgi:hypothetical protein
VPEPLDPDVLLERTGEVRGKQHPC